MRVPEHTVFQALLEEYGQPMMSTTLILPGNEFPETDAWDIREKLEHQVDLVIDGGHCGVESTTVIDVTDAVPTVIRQGKGVITGLD
jgi:tRNA A37 threonylcarbamoyladenosine synthetase subunit TsaC/SUA5/YrdC